MHDALRSLLPPLLACASLAAQGALDLDLRRMLEQKRAADGIPGLSCAAWIGDEVVFARGFGVSCVVSRA